jgi:hypothetical protein
LERDDGDYRRAVESLMDLRGPGEVWGLEQYDHSPVVGFRIEPGMRMGYDQSDRYLIVCQACSLENFRRQPCSSIPLHVQIRPRLAGVPLPLVSKVHPAKKNVRDKVTFHVKKRKLKYICYVIRRGLYAYWMGRWWWFLLVLVAFLPKFLDSFFHQTEVRFTVEVIDP